MPPSTGLRRRRGARRRDPARCGAEHPFAPAGHHIVPYAPGGGTDTGARMMAAGLEREAAMSRVALGKRFTALVGEPPIHYLASWRMHLAR